MTKSKTFSTHNDLPAETRQKVCTILNHALADTFDLASHVKQAHWNVKGLNFIALHEFFDKLHEKLEEGIDLIAERVTTLGGYAQGTARMAVASSRLTEYPTSAVSGVDHLKALVERYGALGHLVRKSIEQCEDLKDAGTQDLFTDILREVDLDLWFLEAHLQNE